MIKIKKEIAKEMKPNLTLFQMMEQARADIAAITAMPSVKVSTIQETKMDTNHAEANARRFMEHIAYSHYHKHIQTLRQKFNMDPPDEPKSIEEAIERLTSGKFTAKPKDQRNDWAAWDDQFTWRDPKILPDVDGYKAAAEKLDSVYAHTKQDIQLDSIADAKKSMRKFEEWLH
jgi:hypothetical protein